MTATSSAYGVPGPLLVDDDFELLEPGAVLRHVGRRFGAGTLVPASLGGQAEVDRWIDFAVLRVGLPAVRGEVETVARSLGVLAAALAGRPWVTGETFTLADVGLSALCLVAPRLPLDAAPAVKAYLGRLAARPAWGRALARVAR
jgi:glutathione S-transferase